MLTLDDAHVTRVRAAIDERRDELTQLVVAFCAIPAQNPPGTHLVESQRWIHQTIERYSIESTTHETSQSGGEHRVIIGSIGDAGSSMYLHGHYDVVPAADRAQFTPAIRDGAIFARGAADMKGGLMAMLIAAVVHRDVGGRGRVHLVYVPDEETGGAHGSERLAERGLIDVTDCVGAIVGEPSYPDIWYAARGAFTVRVTVQGRPAHVGLHYTGINAFEHAHRVIGPLLAYRDDVANRKTSFRIEPEAARSSIMLIGGVVEGGTNFNVVPDTFRFTIDRRPNPDEDYDAARRELLEVLDDLGRECDLSVEILQDVRPSRTDVDDPLIQVIEAATLRTSQRHPPLSMCPGCLETRIYTELDVPSVAFGPGPIEQMHTPSEHVPIENLIEAANVYAIALGHQLGSDTIDPVVPLKRV